MSPVERAVFVARERYLKAVREVLREKGHGCAECTFQLVIVEGKEEYITCRHGAILGDAEKHQTWG